MASAEIATSVRHFRYASRGIGGTLPASKRISRISASGVPGRTRSADRPYMSMKCVLQTSSRWLASKKQSPCDMLLIAVSNCKLRCCSRALSSSRSVMSSWVAMPPPPGRGWMV